MRLNGGVSSSTRPLSRRTRRRSTEAIAVFARSGSPWPLSTAQAWAMASMRHSGVRRRAQRRAVVEVRAAIPRAVPRGFRGGLERHHAIAVAPCALELAPGLGQRGKARQDGQLEPGQPDAFTQPAFANPVHAVVPVAGAHQRQAVSAAVETDVDRPRAVLEQRAVLV